MKRIKKYFFLILFTLLTGCDLMPGMQNPDVSHMATYCTKKTAIQSPLLIPITPSLVENFSFKKYVYHVAPSDILNISVWNHPEFSPKEISANLLATAPTQQGASGREGYLVSQKGTIYFPLVGTVRVAGKTLEEIRLELSTKLKKFIKHPELNVRVVDFRSKKIYVFGEILKPGFIPITDQPLSITDAISLTNGFDPNTADTAHIFVIRGNLYRPSIYWLNAKKPEGLLLAEKFILRPGDILYISGAPAARWNRVLNQLLPTVQTVWYTKAIVDNR